MDTGPTKMAATATGGGLVLAMDKSRMNYGTSLNGAKFTVSGADTGPTKMAATATGGGLVLAMDKSRMNYGTSLNGRGGLADRFRAPATTARRTWWIDRYRGCGIRASYSRLAGITRRGGLADRFRAPATTARRTWWIDRYRGCGIRASYAVGGPVAVVDCRARRAAYPPDGAPASAKAGLDVTPPMTQGQAVGGPVAVVDCRARRAAYPPDGAPASAKAGLDVYGPVFTAAEKDPVGSLGPANNAGHALPMW
ncbi:hypothetical protein [Mycobacterium tuberculosis]|uniref:hypothetical protein n=1 Tax=Mycobacterium tuberculosis TaxID=1773 RepID=UPI002729E02F|nr:hypothetical protein [Mycobacterium tuberculosis]